MKTTTLGACLLLLLALAACQEKPKITTIVMTPIGAFRSPNPPPPLMAFAASDEAENIVAVGQYNGDDCTSPPLGTITVKDDPGSPVATSITTGTIKLPGAGECGGKSIPARCLQITWKGAAPLLTTHQGLRWSYSASPGQENVVDVQVHTVGGGKAQCFSGALS
jgi:hypothetical protein